MTRTVYLSLPANNAATGEPAITGTAVAGQELTATAGTIMDTDGLTGVDFTYQWLRVDADGTSNPADITDATAATYTLTAADAGKKIKVQVSFTDELSGEEERTSAAYPSSGTVTTIASTTAPALLSVTVTSTPHKTTDTYGAREHIEFSMTFDAAVTVTGDPTFAFDLGGPSTATWYAGSGTTTLRFSHAVTGGTSGDRDTNGISWAANAIALNGGTIAGTDNEVAAILTHVAQPNLPAHKVDGRTTPVTPATVTVAVTSTPRRLSADTYGFGETIVITVTVSEAVEVEGDPVFRFSLTNPGGAANDVPATYDRTRSTATTMAFAYTVQAGDMDNNGIWIGDHSRTFMLDANDRIRTASQQIDIDRSHPEKGTQGDHKVDGSLGAPTVPPDPTAPTLVSATATTLTIEWTHPGDGGSPLTRNFIEYRVEGTTDWTNWYRGETPTQVTRTVITNLQSATAYDVRVHSTNAIGNSQWVQSASAFSTLAGTAATGAPTITGTAQVGETLAVDLTGIEDADGLTSPTYTYQWIQVDGTEADIAAANSSTYTLVDADLGKTLKVRVSFDDDGGHTETLTSAATATVTPAAGAPSSPRNLSATVGVGQVVLVWQHSQGGGITHSHYEYRFSAGAMISPDAMWQQTSSSPGLPNTAYYQLVKGLTSDTTHTLQVRAVNPQGGSAPATVTATPLSQPSCTIDELGDRRLLWQGQLVAAVQRVSTDGSVSVGNTGGVETGTLTPAAVTFRSTTYSVITWTSDDRLYVVLRDVDTVWYPRDEVVDALRWHVCNTPYDFSSATPADAFSGFSGYRWNVDSIWPPGIERTLRLSLPPNHAATGDPVISGTVQVGEELTAVTTGIMDDDVLDDVFTYQWVRVDADGTSNEEDITDALSRTYTLTDDDRGKKVKVEVRFVDILGGEETRTSAPTATLAGAPNTAATGAPTITGTAEVGQTLTAVTTGIMDADGLTSPTYTYQWIRVDGTEADIAAANSSTYTLGDADLGTTLKVRVSFDDDAGHTETLTSAATATVVAAATAPTVSTVAVTSTPASGTTYYLAGEVIEFTVTFSAPVTVTATPKFAFRLGAATRQAAYASGSDSAALVFARTVQAGEVDRNGISWNSVALALDGGTITQTGATTAARLTHAAQASLEGHRVDAAPPMQVSASVRGLSLVLVYDEPLDPASMPATGAYTVTATVGATTTNPAVSEVSIYGIWVTLALDAAPAAGATVTLAYAPPASNPVQDEAGNDAPAFSGQEVKGAAGNTAATGAPTITGTAEVGQTLTAVTTGIADADGLTSPTYTYQWIRVNGTEADIAGENSTTYTLVDADLGTTLKVRVSFTDDASNSETLTSAATATVGAAGNTAATGAPTITGTAEVGETLTAVTTGIADADGLTSVSYAYQWIRVNGTEADIAAENSSTYTLVDADLGTTLKVRVSFDRRRQQFRDAHQRGDGDGGRGRDGPDGEQCGGHVNAGLGHHLLPRGRGHRIHRDVQRPGDGDRHTEVRVQAGRGDAAGRLRERLGQRGVGVRPDGAGRRGRSQRHLVEFARARPRRRDHHADGRDDGRAPDPRRAGVAGGAPGGRRPADAGLGVGAGAVAGAGLRRAARSGLDAGDGRVYGDGDGRSHHHEPGGVGGVDIRHLGDADTGRGAGCGRDGDAGVRAAGVEPGAGRGGQRCAGVQRPEGQGRGGQHRRDGRADHHGHGRGGRDADGGHHGHCRRRRADQRQLRVPVDSGGRHGGRHCGREFEHLHPGRRRPGHDPQGAGELHRRRQQFRDAHQRGDGDGGRGGQHRADGRADHHGHGRGGRDADGGHHGHCRRRRADQRQLRVPVDSGERHGGRHCGREFEHLHPGRRRPGHDPQGAGELHRRRQQFRDAHQRGDGDGGRGRDGPDGEHCGGHLDAGLGRHLRDRRDDPVHGDLRPGRDGHGHAGVRVLPGLDCHGVLLGRHAPAGSAERRAVERLGHDDAGVQLHGRGRRHGHRRHLDRESRPHDQARHGGRDRGHGGRARRRAHPRGGGHPARPQGQRRGDGPCGAGGTLQRDQRPELDDQHQLVNHRGPLGMVRGDDRRRWSSHARVSRPE